MRILRERWVAALSATMTAFVAMPSPAQTAPPAPTSDLEEVVVTARKRDESYQNVPITVNVFTAQQIQSAGIESPARLRRDGAEHDVGRDAERRQLLHHHPRHLAGAQQRAVGCRAGRWGARDQSLRVQSGTVRHHADRSAEGPAGRVVRARCDRRRHHHHTPPTPPTISRARAAWGWATGCPRRRSLPSAARSIRRAPCATARR